MQIVAAAFGSLRDVDLFRGLAREEVEECLRLLPAFEATKGQLLVVPGEDDQALYIVERGLVRQYRLSKDGCELTLTELGLGDVFGTLPMIGALSHDTYAVAATDASIYKITAARLSTVIARYPAIASGLLRSIGERLIAAEDKIEDLVFRTAVQRITGQLIKLFRTANRSTLSVSHDEIACRALVARETVTRMLKELERDGVLEIGYRTLRLLDAGSLEERASVS